MTLGQFSAGARHHAVMSIAAPEDTVLVRDWTTLATDQPVFVLEESGETRGRVDAVTEDGKILWLYVEGGMGRRLFARADGDRVWRFKGDALPGF